MQPVCIGLSSVADRSATSPDQNRSHNQLQLVWTGLYCRNIDILSKYGVLILYYWNIYIIIIFWGPVCLLLIVNKHFFKRYHLNFLDFHQIPSCKVLKVIFPCSLHNLKFFKPFITKTGTTIDCYLLSARK